ncbi:MAG TPA: hypothetical protein PKA37_11520 [Planctomycetota bacterium]|nr:hypothetical protein [Planctomycetota bacterium]
MAKKNEPIAEEVIEEALMLGTSIGYRDTCGFVDQLVALKTLVVDPLIRQETAKRAVDVIEVFIAGCFEKADELDDSHGEMAQLVCNLFCEWIRARQLVGADPSETAEALISWKKDDDYGYTAYLNKGAI